MVRLGKGRRPRQSRHCISSAKQGPPTEAGLLVAALDTKRTLRGFARRTPDVVGTAQSVFLSPSGTPALGETFDDARMIAQLCTVKPGFNFRALRPLGAPLRRAQDL
jgi:hypothetical protein